MSNYLKVFVFMVGVSALNSNQVFGAESVLRAGKYSCALEEKSRYLGIESPYTLTLKTKSDGIRTATLSQDGRKLVATEGDLAFVVNKGDLLAEKNWGYWMIRSNDPEYRDVQLTVAVKIKRGEYANHRMKCEATSEPEVVASAPTFFECVTVKPINGKKNVLKFALIHMEDKNNISLWAESEDEYQPIKVTPEDSDLMALNENWRVGLNRNRIDFAGDSDGFYYAEMVLFRLDGYKTGYVRTRSGSEEIDEAYSTISCKVTE